MPGETPPLNAKSNVFSAYQPDSYAFFNAHAEFDSLFENFTRYNRLNNAGDVPRLWSFILNCKQVLAEGVAGDFAELGVWRGNTAAVLAHFAARNNRRVFLFDTFAGFDVSDLKGVDADKGLNADKKVLFRETSIDLVREVIGADAAACDFVKGRFPGSLADAHKAAQYAVVSLDCDLYEPMKAGLEFFYPRLNRGGLFLLHDYSSLHWPGAKLAVDEFCKASGEFAVLMPDKSGSALLRKSKSGPPAP